MRQPLFTARPRAIFARALLESTVILETVYSGKPTLFSVLVIFPSKEGAYHCLYRGVHATSMSMLLKQYIHAYHCLYCGVHARTDTGIQHPCFLKEGCRRPRKSHLQVVFSFMISRTMCSFFLCLSMKVPSWGRIFDTKHAFLNLVRFWFGKELRY